MTKALDSALRLLTRREHGALELCEKLQQKGFSPIEAKDALDNCQRLGLQSDNRFVEVYCRSRIRQGYGPIKISQELKSKGIEPELIVNELTQEKDNWLTYALEVWQKKNKGQIGMSFAEKQKQQRFLLYRGFNMDTITMLMDELK